MSGRVSLVGAGPGDPELLTLKAVKAIARADVILVDDLVSDAVLGHARADARIVHVGKRGGCASTPQQFIERLMIAEARRGHAVVRLKGGDPFIFGRGGEECDALRRAGIEHEVINGITSGLAAATALGIPMTHRDLCHGAILVTGHARPGKRIDWRALAATRFPLIVYMGTRQVGRIAAELIAGGLDAGTPAAAVSNATRPDQRSMRTRLGSLRGDMEAASLASPCILIVGAIAALADDRAWVERLPTAARRSSTCW